MSFNYKFEYKQPAESGVGTIDPGLGYIQLFAAPEDTDSVYLEWQFFGAVPTHDSFELERKLAGEEYALIDTIASGIFNYTDTTVTKGTYIYRVRPIISGEAKDWSNESLTTMPGLQAVDDLSDSLVTDWDVSLTWSPTPFAISYSVYKDGVLEDTTSSSEYLVTDLNAETGYSFTVKANYSAGQSENSNVHSITTEVFEDKWVYEIDTTLGTGDGYDLSANVESGYTVDWGDGTTTGPVNSASNVGHTYSSPGVYRVSIIGDDFNNVRFTSGQEANLKTTRIIRFPKNTKPYKTTTFSGTRKPNWISVPKTLEPNFNNLVAFFAYTDNFSGDLSTWDTSNVISLNTLCGYSTGFTADITGWDVSNCLDFGFLFVETDINQDVSGWDVSAGQDLASMFRLNASFNRDISLWNTSSATTMGNMFRNADAFNIDIGGWDTSNVTNMFAMFANNQTFDQDIGAWNVSSLTTAESMFAFGGLTTANYDALLVGWEGQAPTIQNNVALGAGSTQFTKNSAADTARDNLINTYGWTISDGGST